MEGVLDVWDLNFSLREPLIKVRRTQDEFFFLGGGDFPQDYSVIRVCEREQHRDRKREREGGKDKSK